MDLLLKLFQILVQQIVIAIGNDDIFIVGYVDEYGI